MVPPPEVREAADDEGAAEDASEPGVHAAEHLRLPRAPRTAVRAAAHVPVARKRIKITQFHRKIMKKSSFIEKCE